MGSIIRYEPSVSVSAPRVNTSSGMGEGLQALGQGLSQGTQELSMAARFMQRQENKTQSLLADATSKQYAAKFIGESSAYKEQARQEALADTKGLTYLEKMNAHYDGLIANIQEQIKTDHPDQADVLTAMTIQEMGAWLKDSRMQVAGENTKLAIGHFQRTLGNKYEEANAISQSGHPADLLAAVQHVDDYLATGEALLANTPEKRDELRSKYAQALVEQHHEQDLLLNPELAHSNYLERSAALRPFLDAPTAAKLAAIGTKGQKETVALREDLAADWLGQQKAVTPEILAEGAKAFQLTPFKMKEIWAKASQLDRDITERAIKYEDEKDKRVSEKFMQDFKARVSKALLSGDSKGNPAKAYKEALQEYGQVASRLHADHQTPMLAFIKSLADTKTSMIPNPAAYASLSKMILTDYNSPNMETNILRAELPDSDKEKLIDKLNGYRVEFGKEHKARLATDIKEMTSLYSRSVHKYGGRGVESEIELVTRINDAIANGDKTSATPQEKADYLALQKNPSKHMRILMDQHRDQAEFMHLEDGRRFIEREEAETGQSFRMLGKLATISSMRVTTDEQKHAFQAATDFLTKMDPQRELNLLETRKKKAQELEDEKQRKFEERTGIKPGR